MHESDKFFMSSHGDNFTKSRDTSFTRDTELLLIEIRNTAHEFSNDLVTKILRIVSPRHTILGLPVAPALADAIS